MWRISRNGNIDFLLYQVVCGRQCLHTKKEYKRRKQPRELSSKNNVENSYFDEFMKLFKSQKELPFLFTSKKTKLEKLNLPFINEALENKQAANSFKSLGVNSELTQKLHASGIVQPTHVQNISLPLLLNGKKVIIESATGSGKTLAFLLPILQNMGSKSCTNIVVVPTRELASQIYKESIKYVSDESLVSRHCSGINTEHEKKLLHALKDSKLLIGTPKKLLDIVQDNVGHFRNMKRVVLDEVDKLLPFRLLHGKSQTKRLTKTKPTEKLLALLHHYQNSIQMIATSATISRSLIQELQDMGFTKNCEVVSLNPVEYKHGKVPENIKHFFSVAPANDEDTLLKYCSRLFTHANARNALVFIDRSKSVEKAVDEFKAMGYNASALYKELLLPAPKSFENFLRRFEAGDTQLVVATEETVRGLDFPFIQQVYLTYIPPLPESYVHVAGRAGRLGQSGVVTTIIGESNAKSDKRRLKKYYSMLGIKGKVIQFK